ncbi:MerR family transcriptional regulator [Amycolatopsis sp. WAC 04169]|uniref:MerR family transcriptional regulator n=1 Tax=Amycolatopsis sp. WAC 04169 TaxID=2203197 RepID=UPI000F798BDA|nr:MerR family transcriptional regulator [Amycolatopsis sp. WAC 04169]RSN25536.1 MerR family transcriptional regulator [Amycolatopsis sp. WAC 04169]
MAWSTRELAELAGTTLKTVRYYHRIGLLAEPERGANGYKRYRISHLIRLLRIRRLVELGVPLSDIEAMDESEGNAERTLRALDAELKASIERQERMRKELALILDRRSLVDLPPGFDGDVADLSEVERSMLMVFSRVLDAETMDAVRELHAAPRHPAQAELDALPADADEVTRQRLAEALAPVARDQIEAQPSLTDARTRVALTKHAVLSGLIELYNPAQLDVLRRLNALIEKKEKGP